MPCVCCAVRWVSPYSTGSFSHVPAAIVCGCTSRREDVWEIGGKLHASLTSEIGRDERSAACFGRFDYWEELPEQWRRETIWEMYAHLTLLTLSI